MSFVASQMVIPQVSDEAITLNEPIRMEIRRYPTPYPSCEVCDVQKDRKEKDDEDCMEFYWLVKILTLGMLIVAPIMTFYWASTYLDVLPEFEDWNSEHNYHIVLSVLCPITLSGFAIIVFTMFAPVVGRQRAAKYHAYLHTITLLSLPFGFVTEHFIVFERFNNVTLHAHLESDHSYYGIAVYTLFAIQVLLGLLAYKTTSVSDVRPLLVSVHSSMGMATYMIMVLTCIQGFTTCMVFRFDNEMTNFVGNAATFLKLSASFVFLSGILVPLTVGMSSRFWSGARTDDLMHKLDCIRKDY